MLKVSEEEFSKIEKAQSEVNGKLKRIDAVLQTALGMKKLAKDELANELPKLLNQMPAHTKPSTMESTYVTIDSECKENLIRGSCIMEQRLGGGSKTP